MEGEHNQGVLAGPDCELTRDEHVGATRARQPTIPIRAIGNFEGVPISLHASLHH